jgi:hypothetical protein
MLDRLGYGTGSTIRSLEAVYLTARERLDVDDINWTTHFGGVEHTLIDQLCSDPGKYIIESSRRDNEPFDELDYLNSWHAAGVCDECIETHSRIVTKANPKNRLVVLDGVLDENENIPVVKEL